MEEAIDQFQQALAVQPDFEEAKRNLAVALQVRRGTRDWELDAEASDVVGADPRVRPRAGTWAGPYGP